MCYEWATYCIQGLRVAIYIMLNRCNILLRPNLVPKACVPVGRAAAIPQQEVLFAHAHADGQGGNHERKHD